MTATDPSVQAGGGARALGALTAWVRAGLGGRSTPARLRLAMVLTAGFAVLFAVLGAFGIGRREAALDDARIAAQQLVAVQDLRVRLVHADALASESYLAGAEAGGDLRTTYEAELAEVGALLASVSNGSDARVAEALGAVAGQVGRYAGLVEQAQANNRQGFPIGAAYLRAANTVAAQDAVPALEAVEQALRGQVNAALDDASAAGKWLPLFGVLALLVVLVTGAWVALRFRRWVNLPLAGAAGLVLLLLAVGVSVQGAAMADANDTTAGALTRADLTAQSRAAAFTARTQETAVLIYRGNNADQRAAFTRAMATADEAALAACGGVRTCMLVNRLDSYRSTAEALISDSDSQWEAARATSLGASADLFAAFAAEAEQTAADEIALAAAQLADSTDGLGVLRVSVFIGGLLAAVLALAGLGQRLKEYR